MSNETPFVVPAGVAWTRGTDEATRSHVYVATLPDGPMTVLWDESVLIWQAAVEESGDVVETVAELAGQPADVVREDVLGLLDRLVELGIIAPRR